MCASNKNTSLESLYYNLESPIAFSSVKRFTNFLKKQKPTPDLKNSREWLQGQRAYTLHKPRRVRFQRNHYNLTNIGDFWQADLMDMQSLSRKNKGYKYILAVIDCFSKFGWCVPIKKKQPSEIIRAFQIIFEKCGYKPRNLHTDKGGEFVNKSFKEFLDHNDITFYKASDPVTKTAICERYIRTIKSLIFRYFTYSGSDRYCEILESLIGLYNNRRHRSIGMAPADVNEKNVLQVWQNLNKSNNVKRYPLLRCGDFVRLAKPKEVFDKGYKALWTSEIFVIKKVIAHQQPVYRINDLEGNDITGSFYEQELQKVTYASEAN